MRPSIPATIALAVAAASPASAAELLLGWGLDSVWSSNVFRTSDESLRAFNDPSNPGRTILRAEKIPKEDDFSFRTGPNFRLREVQGDFLYDVDYRLRYEEFVRLDGISEFDHNASASASWNATDRLILSASDVFVDTASLGAATEFIGTTPTQVLLEPDIVIRPTRERLQRNAANASARYRVGPRSELTISGDHELYEYEDDVNADSMAFGASAQLTRSITRRLVAGFGGSVQRQEFRHDTANVDDGGTSFAQAYAVANYQISRTLRLAASAGPALSMPDDVKTADVEVVRFQPWEISTCPERDGERVVPLSQAVLQTLGSGSGCSVLTRTGTELGVEPGNDNVFVPLVNPLDRVSLPFEGDTGIEDSLTYFARVSIEKQWQLWNATLSYSRSASSGSGFGTSTIVDAWSGELRWTPTQRATLRLRGGLTMQSAVSAVNQQLVSVVPGVRNVTFQGALEDADSDPSNNPVVQVTRPVVVPIPQRVISGEKIDNPIDVRSYRVELRSDYRVSRNLSANGLASWYLQTNSSELQDGRRQEFRVVVGMTWTFDPIPL